MKLPVIETKRLLLTPLKLSDAERIFQGWTSDTRVTKFMIYSTHKTVEETKAWLKTVVSSTENESAKSVDVGFRLKENGMLIGTGGAYYKPEYNRWSLGYNIAFDYWHQGYTSEAMKALTEYLCSMGIKRFFSDHAVDNPNSGKVMEKIGMKFDHMGSYSCHDGREFEAKYYIMDMK